MIQPLGDLLFQVMFFAIGGCVAWAAFYRI